ncbi:MAG: aminoglycoside phosphotransferase family protein [Hamadaea sp.]|nr:aminoglycoside phosphotransferase family protein [Hamadaea sp.]NUR47538.1 aminoglycoside phosphotransferase family protein [Hamadaea sp.]NUT07770.1 aminoglycoside phosphotransferase family protein [Hamadaea sp.]
MNELRPEDWATTELTARGISVHEVTWPHRYPWSQVAKITTDAGDMWLKLNLADTVFEAGLLRLLGTLVPAHVVVPLAVDAVRGWSLSPDGGVTLRATEDGKFRIEVWEQMLGEYADLQRSLTPHVADLLAVGTPDLRPHRLPELFDLLLDEPLVRANVADQLDALAAVRPAVVRAAEELAASGIAPTLQHDDLHDANVLVRGDKHAFFDWGDASVAHPFGTLLVTLRVAARKAEVEEGDPLLARLRDAYLEAWTGEHARTDLVRWADAALTVTKISRAMSYRRSLQDAEEKVLTEYGEGVWGWFAELLEPNPI